MGDARVHFQVAPSAGDKQQHEKFAREHRTHIEYFLFTAIRLLLFPPSLLLLSYEHTYNAKCIQHRQYDFGFLKKKALSFKVQSRLYRLFC